MGTMTLVACSVRIMGDLNHVIPPADRGFGTGIISWPEAVLLRAIHGADDCLEGLMKVGTADTDPTSEKARLARFYDGKMIESVYPGAVPQMAMTMPRGEGIGELAASSDHAGETPKFRLDAPPAYVPPFKLDPKAADGQAPVPQNKDGTGTVAGAQVARLGGVPSLASLLGGPGPASLEVPKGHEMGDGDGDDSDGDDGKDAGDGSPTGDDAPNPLPRAARQALRDEDKEKREGVIADAVKHPVKK